MPTTRTHFSFLLFAIAMGMCSSLPVLAQQLPSPTPVPISSPSIPNDPSEQAWAEAVQLEKIRQFESAAKTYRKILDLEQAKPSADKELMAQALNRAASCYYALGQFDQAIVQLQEAVKWARDLKTPDGVIILLNNLGALYQEKGHFEQAIATYKEAITYAQQKHNQDGLIGSTSNLSQLYQAWGKPDLALTELTNLQKLAQEVPNKEVLLQVLNRLGSFYQQSRQWAKASEFYQQGLVLSQQLKKDDYGVIFLNRLAYTAQQSGQIAKALAGYKQSLELAKKMGQYETVINILASQGELKFEQGQQADALADLLQALEVAKAINKPVAVAGVSNILGNFHYTRLEYDKALAYYEQSMHISREIKYKPLIATSLNNMGRMFDALDNYEVATDYYLMALSEARSLGNDESVSAALNNLALIYMSWGKFAEAQKYLDEALSLAVKAKNTFTQGLSLRNLGHLNRLNGKATQALAYYQKALPFIKALNKPEEWAKIQRELGLNYMAQNMPGLAQTHFEEALKAAEKSGLSHLGVQLLDHLAFMKIEEHKWAESQSFFLKTTPLLTQIHAAAMPMLKPEWSQQWVLTYQGLIASQCQQPGCAFHALIQSQQVQLQDTWPTHKSLPPPYPVIQASLAKDEGMLAYANMDWQQPWMFAVSSQKLLQTPLPMEVIKKLPPAEQQALQQLRQTYQQHLRPSTRRQEVPQGRIMADQLGLLIEHYRRLLANPNSDRSRLKTLGKSLYQLLIAPQEGTLKGIHRLYVVPDGPLALLPFETLVDPQGHYLIERFEIAYLPRISSKVTLTKVIGKAPQNWLMATDVLYQEQTYQHAPITHEVELNTLRKAFAGATENQHQELYGELLGPQWSLTNTTLKMPGSKVLSQQETTEAAFKKLDLTVYQGLHIGLHTLPLTEIPEMSAVVLAQPKETQAKEDGYLRLAEIAQLKLKAKLVSLPMTNPALTRQIGSAGLTSLAYAFMQAGAQAVAVSLWMAPVEATWLPQWYQQADSLKALTQYKRGLLKEHPHHWARLVYYGL